MPAALAEFHFLRPEWLWLALPAALVVWLILRGEDPVAARSGSWSLPISCRTCSSARAGASAFGPHTWWRSSWPSSIVALAGPSWQREVPPFAQDKASLVVALDLSRSMDAIDVSPSRLERAKQKVRDLLALRQGARTALRGLRGHRTHRAALDRRCGDPRGLPRGPGHEPDAGPREGRARGPRRSPNRCSPRSRVPGTILFVTDGIAAAQVPAFVAHRQKSPNQVVALGVGTSEGGPIRDGKGFLTEARPARGGQARQGGPGDAGVGTPGLRGHRHARRQRREPDPARHPDPHAVGRPEGPERALPGLRLVPRPVSRRPGRALVPARVDHSLGHRCVARPSGSWHASRGRRLALRRPLGHTRPAGALLLRARRLQDRGGALRESRCGGASRATGPPTTRARWTPSPASTRPRPGTTSATPTPRPAS